MGQVIALTIYKGTSKTDVVMISRDVIVVVVSVKLFCAGVPGYETITDTTPAPQSVRRLPSVKFASVVHAVVEHGEAKGGKLEGTVQGLIKDASFCASKGGGGGGWGGGGGL